MFTRIGWRIFLVLSFIFLFAFYSCAFMQNRTDEVEAHSQSDDSFRVHVDVDLVTTDITVIGNAVPQLKKEDFVVYDNKVAQNLNYFSQDQLSLAVALLIDISGSVARVQNELQLAALTALRRLKPEDQVVLYSFSDSSQRLSGLTEDRLQIATLLRYINNSRGGTNVYGALHDAARYLRKEAPHSRKAIILISDNIGFGGRDAARCQAELLESSITLYSIAIDWWRKVIPILSGMTPKSVSIIKQMAAETGGEYFEVKGLMSVKTALEDAISRLRMQYTLGFNPSDHGQSGQFHSLIVRFADEKRCPNCSIIGRKGYYAGVAAPLSFLKKTIVASPSSLDNANQLITRQILFIAGTQFPDLHEIPFKLSTAVQTDTNGMQLHIEIVIDSKGIRFVGPEIQRSYKAVAAAIRADSNRKITGVNIWSIADQLSIESYQHIKETGISFGTTIPLTVPSKYLQVVLYDENSDRIASRLVQIKNYKIKR